MSDRLTGKQARELLAEFNNPRTAIGHIRVRPLLEQLAWLYGRGHDEEDRVWLTSSWRVDVSLGGRVRLMLRDEEVDDLATWAHYIEPDEAVDLARALLSAAEEARP